MDIIFTDPLAYNDIEYFKDSNAFTTSINVSTTTFDAIVESCNDFYVNNHYYTEGVLNSLSEGIKKFFERIKKEMEKFRLKIIEFLDSNARTSSVANKVAYNMKQKETKRKIKETLDQLYAAKKDGKRNVKIVDIRKYSKTVHSYHKSLIKMGKRFTEINFRSTVEIDEALARFNISIDKMDKELCKMWDHPKKMNIDEAITMLENEVTGKSVFCQVIEDDILAINNAAIAADKLQKNREKNNASCLPHHISILQRITSSISAFARKHVSRFIFGKMLWSIF